MGAFRVPMQIRNKEIDILYSHMKFSCKTDVKVGLVATVIGGRITFSVESI